MSQKTGPITRVGLISGNWQHSMNTGPTEGPSLWWLSYRSSPIYNWGKEWVSMV